MSNLEAPRENLARTAYQQLKQDIIESYFSPGEKLLMSGLKTRYGLGVSPLREALSQLVSERLVTADWLAGNLGKPGAGLCPVRGHSNVQGDRTMGIYEKMPDSFLDRLAEVYGFEPPRKHGFDTVDAIKAMHAEKGKTFIALGGNFKFETRFFKESTSQLASDFEMLSGFSSSTVPKLTENRFKIV